MKTLLTIFLFFAALCICRAQPSEFNEPWKDTTRAIILDPYQGNDMDWEKIATDKRVVAIIHKATQGSKVDKYYSARKIIGKAKGYKWGSYHLGTPGDPLKQADFYLQTVGINSDEVYALDLESLEVTSSMSLENAVIFINRIFEKTGRYPLVYCNWVVLDGISTKFDSSSVFAKCPLWYARFRKVIPFKSRTWKRYTVLQFSSEIYCGKTPKTCHCPYEVPGTNGFMDIDVYNGTITELFQKWPNL